MKRLGIVGYGAIAQAYVQALADSEFAKIQAVGDVREAALKQAAETTACETFSSFDDMMNQAELDGVIISTPP
ncbi:MAG: Gfo/Idh/MocA family oxidoreductase, partial [Pseudomonadota bacterium]